MRAERTALGGFLSGPAGNTLSELFQLHVDQSVANPYIERFRPRPVTHSIVTVLFGSSRTGQNTADAVPGSES